MGGITNSKPVLKPGEMTYAKIIFYNNCGFDWNMEVVSIDFEYKGLSLIIIISYYMVILMLFNYLLNIDF